MKKRRLNILALMIVTVVVGFCVWKARSDPVPVLVFKGYEGSGMNSVQYAKFELRNTTSSTIWLCYQGREFPLEAPFCSRPIAVALKEKNTLGTNVYSFWVGSHFMRGEKISPGKKMLLNFPLTSGKPTEQVSIMYYLGDFKDGNDFLSNLWGTPFLNNRATWKEKSEFYWEKLKKHFKPPQPREIWCPQPVTFQPNN